jgi:hypothetical protein
MIEDLGPGVATWDNRLDEALQQDSRLLLSLSIRYPKLSDGAIYDIGRCHDENKHIHGTHKSRVQGKGMCERNETRVATRTKAARSIKRSRLCSWNILRGLISK